MTNTHIQGKATNPFLSKALAPLSKHYAPTDAVEIRIVRPGRVMRDRRGKGKEAVDDPELTLAVIEGICTSLANKHGLKFDADTHPKLSCVLPGGHRFECLLGASVQSGISLAIRCKHPFTPTWEQMGVTEPILKYLLEAVELEKNIIVSGSTNTGKTTLLNKFIDTLPDDERLVAVEDAPELHIDKFEDDGTGLLADREANADSSLITYRGLYDHKMRITPGRIVFGEISTLNAGAFLNALTAGVAGMMCSIHGNNPHQLIKRKFIQLTAMGGEVVSDAPEILMETIHMIVQIKRDKDGFRRITDIYEPINDHYVLKDGKEITS